jgi:hypothetical protein
METGLSSQWYHLGRQYVPGDYPSRRPILIISDFFEM